MGRYTQLYLDKYYFSWKYDIPSFLSFFFKENMFYKEIQDSEGEDDDNVVFEEIGYKCSVKQSIEILDNYGYDFDKIVDVYGFFYSEFYQVVKERLIEVISSADRTMSEKELERKLQLHLDTFPKLSREEELRDFCKNLPSILDSTHGKIDSKHFIIDFEEIHMGVIGKELEYSPWTLIICELLDWEMLREFFEILSMFYFRLFLESMPKEAILRLDLNDIVDEEQEVKELHSELATRLVDKINLYNKFFNPLITKEDFLKEKYIKSRGLELFNACLVEKNSYTKVQMLETLTELIFTSNKSLKVSSSRVKTGDEEIDLVIVNNMTTAFWTAFGSMFFVECKNWNKKIGSKEMRDFETKLRNHNNVTHLGFFVSINGFTREAINHLKRIGRENYHIVLIGRPEIEEYLNGKMTLFEWLGKKVEKIY
nr:DUF2034 domain-containing protein [uncultured Carboxylicivirga sp.]